MATATSSPPAPIASMPTAPAVGVWLSVPSSVHPGRVEAFQVHLVADAVAGLREEDAVAWAATVIRYWWSSAFSKPSCSVRWST